MNLEEAKEILKPYERYKEIPFYGFGEAHRVLEAKAFLEGYEQGIRDATEKLFSHVGVDYELGRSEKNSQI